MSFGRGSSMGDRRELSTAGVGSSPAPGSNIELSGISGEFKNKKPAEAVNAKRDSCAGLRPANHN